MATEIERKFLVRNIPEALKHAISCKYVYQAYISTDEERCVRVTHTKAEMQKAIVPSEHYYLCIKGKLDGISRPEFEYEISKEDAYGLFKLAQCSVRKHRYYIPFQGHMYELDIFDSEHSGLCIAEIELKSEDEVFQKPSWLGAEVTDDPSYYNLNIALLEKKSKRPYEDIKENYA